MPHQYLLTSRMNRGFKIYVVPLERQGSSTIGLVSAFFDDIDNPLTVWTPIAHEPHAQALLQTLQISRIFVRMVDEHNRELLAYEAMIDIPPIASARITSAKLYPTAHDIDLDTRKLGETWFGMRSTADDEQAITVSFLNPLYEEDRKFRDERPELFTFHGSAGFAEVSLVRLEPGQFQEMDILLMLQRIFNPQQIYHAPLRKNDREEICDVLVVADDYILIIQAKDSPNTEKMLSSSFDRKRSKAKSQLDDGCNQVAGAIGYLKRTHPLQFIVDKKIVSVEIEDKEVLSLVVIRERITYDYQHYSARLMRLHQKIGIPCLGIGFVELTQYCTFCDGPDGFRKAYWSVFNDGIKTGVFKQLRFGVKDLYTHDGEFRF